MRAKVWVAMAAVAGWIGAPLILYAQVGAKRPMLLVLAKRDERLAIVNPATLKVVAKVPSGGNPHEVIASPDGQTAWISNYGNGALNTITVVDVGSAAVRKTIDLGPIRGPHGFSFAEGKVWFTAEREKLIGRIDPWTETVDWLMGTGQTGTHMLWVAPDATEIVTVNVGSGSMDLFKRKPVGPLQSAGGHRRRRERRRRLGKTGRCRRTGMRRS